jgi:copper homeostasis protein (lipoprotein)
LRRGFNADGGRKNFFAMSSRHPASPVSPYGNRLLIKPLPWVLVWIFLASGCGTLLQESDMAAERKGTSMTGLFRYMADAALFSDCATGETFPVAMEKDYLALERAYLASPREPGGPLRVDLVGYFAQRPPMEGEGLETVLVVERFEAIYPDGDCPPLPAVAALEDTHWKLIALYGEPVQFTAQGLGAPHLLLRTPERQMSGFSGCNGFFGLYQLRGDRLWFEDMAATMQACPNNHDLQTTFYEALKATRRFQIMDAVLILYDEQNEVARFTAVTR